eukprot:m.254508 g.254508  ORF g.254508 m.254508 type:complete len:1047 (+) comp26731_c1_seq3:106-3246(+)
MSRRLLRRSHSSPEAVLLGSLSPSTRRHRLQLREESLKESQTEDEILYFPPPDPHTRHGHLDESIMSLDTNCRTRLQPLDPIPRKPLLASTTPRHLSTVNLPSSSSPTAPKLTETNTSSAQTPAALRSFFDGRYGRGWSSCSDVRSPPVNCEDNVTGSSHALKREVNPHSVQTSPKPSPTMDRKDLIQHRVRSRSTLCVVIPTADGVQKDTPSTTTGDLQEEPNKQHRKQNRMAFHAEEHKHGHQVQKEYSPQKKTDACNFEEGNNNKCGAGHAHNILERKVADTMAEIKLRGPRALFHVEQTVNFTPCPPHFPVEIDLAFPGPVFERHLPPEPEAYITPLSQLKIDKSPKFGSLVYSCERTVSSLTTSSFTTARVGLRYSSFRNGSSCGELAPFYQPTSPQDDTLVFESRFESGNLLKAYRVGPAEYSLVLRKDLRTSRHTQWFFFSIRNTRAGQTYKFNIVNLLKSDSLYNHGMQPVVYSQTDKEKGWRREGHDVCYFMNRTPITQQPNFNVNATSKSTKPDSDNGRKSRRYFYTLSFSWKAKHDNDEVFFAHCYPYTYSDLQDYLRAKCTDLRLTNRLRRRTLCKTLAGNVCDLLTITSFGDSPLQMASRKGVFVTARVHPGETNASWMMKGLIDFLLSDDADAAILRENFVFKIVPMLNPDGVIVGNYRCNLAGVDLNRNYLNPSPNLHPTVYYTITTAKQFAKDRSVVVYCDLHGHSRQHGVFVYGCHNQADPSRRLMERVFPFMMAKLSADKFLYNRCKFRVQKSKEATGRVQMWRQLRLVNAFTMESTFCGSQLTQTQFSMKDFEQIGADFCDTLLDYCDPDPAKVTLSLSEIRTQAMRRLMQKLCLDEDTTSFETLLQQTQGGTSIESDLESSSAGSDSSADEQGPTSLPLKQKRKRRVKTRTASCSSSSSFNDPSASSFSSSSCSPSPSRSVRLSGVNSNPSSPHNSPKSVRHLHRRSRSAAGLLVNNNNNSNNNNHNSNANPNSPLSPKALSKRNAKLQQQRNLAARERLLDRERERQANGVSNVVMSQMILQLDV